MVLKNLFFQVKFGGIFFSTTLHLLLIAVLLGKAREEMPQFQSFTVSLISLAAPNTASAEDKRNIVMRQDDKGEVAQQKIQKGQQTANNNGRDISNVITEGKYRYQVPPIYPKRSLELSQQGLVKLHVLVKEDGSASELRIADSSGYHLLDAAAVAAVKKWQFEPVIQGGSIVVAWVEVPVKFVITN